MSGMNRYQLLQLGLMVAGAALFVGALWLGFALLLSLAQYVPSQVR
jgi:hypothetical protein